MRMNGGPAAIAAACILTTTAIGAGQDTKGNEIMAQVRKALGGEQKLAAVKALSLRATYQREMSMPGMAGGGRAMITVQGGPPGGDAPQVTGDIELDLELPGKYIKIDTSTGFMAMTRTEGFDGDRPFMHAASANPGMRIQMGPLSDDPGRMKEALHRNQAELARLLLGILGSTQASFPATFTYGGIAESVDGKAHIIEVMGPEKFAARLFVDLETHLPLMLTYQAPEPRIVVRTVDRAEGPRNAERDRVDPDRQADAEPAKLIEHRIFFSDYREVDGLSFPHRVARGTAQKMTEEWEVKSYKVNPQLAADRFKVS
jgi:hypothetical protein